MNLVETIKMKGMMCGLPILYRNSGCFPEYCNGYGISFDNVDDFENKLLKMMREYDHFRIKNKKLDRGQDKTINNYISLFQKLLKDRLTICKRRKLFKNPLVFILNLIIN